MKIKDCDIADGEGVRVTLFVSGCPLHCFNCQNKEAWDFYAGKPFTAAEIDKLLALLKKDYINGFTLCGGEPLCPQNITAVKDLLKIIRTNIPNKTIWCYTGYIYESINALNASDYRHKLLSFIDILVDGPFIEAEKDITLRFKGSRNQRIIKLNSIADNKSKSVCANIIG